MKRIETKSGEKFGHLTFIEEAPSTGNGKPRRRGLFMCICGNELETNLYSVRSGATKSCGCQGKFFTPEDSAMYNISSKMLSSMKRNYKVEINQEQMHEIMLNPCAYCGEEGSNKTKGNKRKIQGRGRGCDISYNGIDRIDSSMGYIEGNVCPCCKRCNYMKRHHSKESFLNKIKKIYEFNNKQTGQKLSELDTLEDPKQGES